MKTKLVLISLMLALSACAVPKYGSQYYHSPDFNFSDAKGKTVGIFVVNHGKVDGYEKGFKKVYGEKGNFAGTLEESALTYFKNRGIKTIKLELSQEKRKAFTEELNEYKTDWNEIPEELRQTVREAAKAEKLDYLLLITHYTISGKWQHTAGTATTGANGQWNNSGGHSTKTCYVTLVGGILDAEGTPLYFGEGYGQAEVFMFSFKSTLKQGVADALSKFGQLVTGSMAKENVLY